MQSVKFVMRIVGDVLDAIPAADFEEYLQYQFLSDGYKIFAQHIEPIYEEAKFKGFRVFITLVKDEEIKAAKAK